VAQYNPGRTQPAACGLTNIASRWQLDQESGAAREFNYPTETAVNDIHETTVQPGGDVTAVTAFILPA
jgi:hypothetical protein